MMQMPDAHQYWVAMPKRARHLAPSGSVLRTKDATPIPPHPKPMKNLQKKYCQKPKDAAEMAAPILPISNERYIAGLLPEMSASCPMMPAPKKNPTKNIESAAETFHSSLQMRFHSDTIDADFETHSQSSSCRLQISPSPHPSSDLQRHAGMRAVKTDIKVRNTAGTQATEESTKCFTCALPISPTCRLSISSTVNAVRASAWNELTPSAKPSSPSDSILLDDISIATRVSPRPPLTCGRPRSFGSMLADSKKAESQHDESLDGGPPDTSDRCEGVLS